MALNKRRDPGTGTNPQFRAGRTINKDGSFNVKRLGRTYILISTFEWLINLKWSVFFLMLILGYSFINLIFALIYLYIGVDHIGGTDTLTTTNPLLIAYFFSFQTFTTVGYGALHPVGLTTNIIASFEAFLGFMMFAIATGLLYSRFSRPKAKILFSKNALIVDKDNKRMLQFRIGNLKNNALMEAQIEVIMQKKETGPNGPVFNFYNLKLERKYILFFPLNWTIVHEIDQDSPLYGYDISNKENFEFEILIHFKAFDDTYSEHVHQRFSYTSDEVEFGCRFVPTYYTDKHGHTIFDLNKISQYTHVN
ncbi:ion channel [Marinigracilibium pacificum]|uniref:Inward rectifier potassium channel Irk n=1 Tax=Marinigracilibium pacificum TaxID=2729599 RepID=A0A848J4R6_9BACT|nr:ion channel [Marinigracilibium pacificum]NMM50475.1 Inward rectifier potassium channel Irk [Marinigracilibium pacificum]